MITEHARSDADLIGALLEEVRVRPRFPTPGVCRDLREAAGLSIRRVAGAVGAAPMTVHRWETGESQPSGERAARYARLLAGLADASVA